MNARIAYKKNKIVSERSSWIVSIYDKPFDIMKHDKRTIDRLINEVYGKKSKNQNKEIILYQRIQSIYSWVTMSIGDVKVVK